MLLLEQYTLYHHHISHTDSDGGAHDAFLEMTRLQTGHAEEEENALLRRNNA